MSVQEQQKIPAAETLQWGELLSLKGRVDGYYEWIRGGHPVVGRVPGPGAIELWSNDYLSLSRHPAIVRAHVEALQGGENDLYMSAAYLNEESTQRRLEKQMAGYLGAEATVLCQSGWCANVGLVQALADKDTPVYLDMYAHASLWEGVRAAEAPTHAFRHNRVNHLERLITRHGPGLIIVDAIYSSTGTICPLREIAELGERAGCILLVDESHSIGVYGANGEGLVPLLGLTDKVHYRTFSLSKAFVTRAGMVAGPQRVMEYFPYEARPAIFSSAVLPHEVAGLSATLQVVQEEDWRRQQLWYNAHYLRRRLSDLGYAVDNSSSQVISLTVGKEEDTIRFRNALEEQGVFGAVFCAPATPRNHSLIRLSVNAGLNEEHLDQVITACAKIRDKNIIPKTNKLLFRQMEVSPEGRTGHSWTATLTDALSQSTIRGVRSLLHRRKRGVS